MRSENHAIRLHGQQCLWMADSGRRHQRRGAMLVFILVCLPVILAFAVFAINVAWMQLTRTELRTATDAAARAGSRTLSLTQNIGEARAASVAAARNNLVAGDPLLLAPSDLQFGHTPSQASGLWKFSPRSPSADDINSVRVTGRRVAGSPSGPVSMLFTGLFDSTTFQPVKVATATHIDRDVVLVLDRSGSMVNDPHPSGTRWGDLKVAVETFLVLLRQTPQSEQVGLATYATEATLDLPLTLDYSAVMNQVNETMCEGSTAIGKGIYAGQSLANQAGFSRPFAAKTMVVMTDGIHNEGVSPLPAAADCRAQSDITVHTITFSPGADQLQMKEAARLGGGQHWHADDQASLIRVFEEIANNLPTLLTE